MLEINRNKIPLYDKYKIEHYPEVSEKQAAMMLHALGADHKSERKRQGRKYYHAYRNYYDAGGKDRGYWNDLVKKGLADYGGHFYHVTVYGIRLLELLTQCGIYDNRQNVADCRKDAIEFFIRDEVAPCYGCWMPTTTKQLATALAIPMRLARDTVHRLEADGLIKKGHYGGCDDRGYPYCYHGYYITKKLIEWEEYEEIKKQEYRKVDERLKQTEDGD